MTTTYTTSGSVRGGCGHAHRTVEAAVRCLARDQASCHRCGGGAYSDREVIGLDGQTIPTTTDDDGRLIVDEDAICADADFESRRPAEM